MTIKKIRTAPVREDWDIYQKDELENYPFYKHQKKATECDKQGFSYGLKSSKSPPQVKDWFNLKMIKWK